MARSALTSGSVVLVMHAVFLVPSFCVKGSLLCTATGCRLTHQQACPLLDAESSAHTGAHPFASCPNRFGAQRLASRKTT